MANPSKPKRTVSVREHTTQGSNWTESSFELKDSFTLSVDSKGQIKVEMKLYRDDLKEAATESFEVLNKVSRLAKQKGLTTAWEGE